MTLPQKQNKRKHPTAEDRVYRLLSPPWLSVEQKEREGMEGERKGRGKGKEKENWKKGRGRRRERGEGRKWKGRKSRLRSLYVYPKYGMHLGGLYPPDI